jgi:hypothetical protein
LHSLHEDSQQIAPKQGDVAAKDSHGQGSHASHTCGTGSTEAGHRIVERKVVDARFRAVEAQLQMLGTCHVGFSSLPVDGKGLSIVGARPFAKVGGSSCYG